MNPIIRSVPDRQKDPLPSPLGLRPQKFCEEEVLFILPKHQDEMVEGACFSLTATDMGSQAAESYQTGPGEQQADSDLPAGVPALAPLHLVCLCVNHALVTKQFYFSNI